MTEYKIYLLRCRITGKSYVGVTSMSLEERWHNGQGYKNQPVIYDDICEYGWNNFEHSLIDTAFTYKESREKERFYIKTMNSLFPNGYNIISGETGLPNRLWKSTIIKIDENGNILQKFSSSKQLKRFYTKNQIRTIRECLFSVQKDFRPRFYEGGYWGFQDIYTQMMQNLGATISRRKNGLHTGVAKKLQQISMDGTVVHIFSSQREAVRNIPGAKKSTMQAAINSNKIYLGFYWKYIE